MNLRNRRDSTRTKVSPAPDDDRLHTSRSGWCRRAARRELIGGVEERVVTLISV